MSAVDAVRQLRLPPPEPLEDDAGPDRLMTALLVALALHALLILGVGFSLPEPPPQDRLPTLDITLVPKQNDRPPEDPDYLAETSQRGAGNVTEKVQPQEARVAAPANTPPPAEPAPQPPQLVAERSRTRVEQASKTPAEPPKQASAAELINRSMELVNLEEQLRQSIKAYSKQPREKFISASTREFKYASYMNDWVAKVERVGNLNYPDEARRKKLSGKLLLDVALNADGSVRSIRLVRSSGYKVLDDAAIRIVQLASPFPPLPAEIRAETSVLHIIRTWEFLSSNRLKGH